MAGTKKTWDKATSKETLKTRLAPNPFKKGELEKSFLNPAEGISEGAEDFGGLFTPDIPEPEEETIIPMSDPNVTQTRTRKKRAQQKGSGRSSTILTEGLGG
jgi:hypothetical protein